MNVNRIAAYRKVPSKYTCIKFEDDTGSQRRC